MPSLVFLIISLVGMGVLIYTTFPSFRGFNSYLVEAAMFHVGFFMYAVFTMALLGKLYFMVFPVVILFAILYSRRIEWRQKRMQSKETC